MKARALSLVTPIIREVFIKTIVKRFNEFAMPGNVPDLAIDIIVSSAFGKVEFGS